MKIAYFDCFCGISGDMTLGAFINMGIPADWIQQTIRENLNVDFELMGKTVYRMGISATQAEIHITDSQQRNYSQICRMIKDSNFTDNVKKTSLTMFDTLAEAEAKLHGCPKEQVHFHELGGVDAIVDIVGSCLCADYLRIDKVISSKIPLGRGFVHCSHGTLPVPAPATLEILKETPVSGTDISFESVTPTGATIIKTLAERFGNIPDMKISKIGYGAGRRDCKSMPNLLRIITGEGSESSDAVMVIETNIDDMNPEIYGFLMERLFEDGALDVFLTPIYMKKNRPGTLLKVLCHRDRLEAIISRIFSETTSLGIRYYNAERRILDRQEIKIDTPFGKVAAKRVQMADGNPRIIPEYESCRDIARKENIPIRTVYDIISKFAENSCRFKETKP